MKLTVKDVVLALSSARHCHCRLSAEAEKLSTIMSNRLKVIFEEEKLLNIFIIVLIAFCTKLKTRCMSTE